MLVTPVRSLVDRRGTHLSVLALCLGSIPSSRPLLPPASRSKTTGSGKPRLFKDILGSGPKRKSIFGPHSASPCAHCNAPLASCEGTMSTPRSRGARETGRSRVVVPARAPQRQLGLLGRARVVVRAHDLPWPAVALFGRNRWLSPPDSAREQPGLRSRSLVFDGAALRARFLCRRPRG